MFLLRATLMFRIVEIMNAALAVFYSHFQNLRTCKINKTNVFSGVFFVWNAKNIIKHSREILNFR